MTTRIDMNPQLQPAGAVNGFVREKHSVTKPPTNLSESNKDVSESSGIKLNTEKINVDDLNAEKLDSNKLDNEKKTELEKAELNDVVTNLNSTIQSVQRDLEFSVDDSSGQVVINVKDKETDKVVRQIPSEEALKLAENLQELVDSRQNNDSGNTVEGIFVRTSA